MDDKINDFYFHKAVGRAGSESTEHYHTTYEIYYMKDGRCKYFINERSYNVIPGDVIFIPAGIIHRTNYGKNPHSRLLINFTEDYIPEAIKEHLSDFEYLYRSREVTEGMESMLARIEKEYSNPDAYTEGALKCHTGEIFYLLLRNPQKAKNDITSSTLIESAIRYIQHNYMHDITLSHIAKHSSVSPEHFSRIFKKNTGFGFNEYITLLRLQRAEYMLKHEPGKPISEIAYDCGFNDGNYFSYKFKQKYGIPPTHARGKE